MSPSEYLLDTDCYEPELIRLLSSFSKFDLNREGWVVPAENLDIVKKILEKYNEFGVTEGKMSEILESIQYQQFYSSLPHPLYDHQRTVLPKIIKSDGFLLADDMGLGKSVTTLAAVLYCVQNFGYKKVLIFSQKRAVKQWIGYSRNFTPKLQLVHVDGSPQKRRSIWGSVSNIIPTVYITNLEKIIPDFEHIVKTDWDMVVLDEASYYIKNPNSKRSKKSFRIKSKKYLALTGTPIENSLVDLYSIFKFINPDLFGEYFNFERKYVVFVTKKLPIFRYGRKIHIDIKKIVGYRNVEELKKQIAPFYMRRTEKDIDIKLPQIVSQDFIIPLLKEQEEVYKVEKDKVLGSEKVNTEFNRVRLLRICDHALFSERGIDSSNKIEELLSLIQENLHRKMIVFSMWADMVRQIDILLSENHISHSVVVGSGSKEKFGRVINDEEEFNKFRENNNILVATDAVSRSQDFPFVSVIINVDLPWNPATIQQRIMRARRLSSTHETIFVFNLVSENTIEEKVLPVLAQKIKLARDVIDENQYVVKDIEFDLTRLLEGGKHDSQENKERKT